MGQYQPTKNGWINIPHLTCLFIFGDVDSQGYQAFDPQALVTIGYWLHLGYDGYICSYNSCITQSSHSHS